MKKIIAILVSLLFLGSVVGITSLSADGLTVECYLDKNIVHRGEYVTYTMKLCNPGGGSDYVTFLSIGSPPFLELVSYDVELNTTYEIKPGECLEAKAVYRATDFGEINECGPCGCFSLKVLPKPLPMQQFMKILGFGQQD
jgi:hypothetical protein